MLGVDYIARMGLVGNLALAALGCLVEGGLLVWGATWVERRISRPTTPRPVRAVATISRPEVPTPPRRELTR
jgi:hypothetical protein